MPTLDDVAAYVASLPEATEGERHGGRTWSVGKKVFADGAVPTNVTLLEPPVAGPKGTVYLRYGLAEGTPRTGDMGAPDRGV